MVFMVAPRKAGPSKPKAQGAKAPRVEGAPDKAPVVGPTPKPRPRKKNGKTPKDPVERSDSYTRKESAVGIMARAEAQRKQSLLKRLIEPLTPGLIQVCVDIAYDKKVHAAVRLDAATRLMDRAFGKPKEHLEITDPGEETNTDEVRQLLNNILESVGAPLLDSPMAASDATEASQERNAQGDE